jgi:hypothetical protein
MYEANSDDNACATTVAVALSAGPTGRGASIALGGKCCRRTAAGHCGSAGLALEGLKEAGLAAGMNLLAPRALAPLNPFKASLPQQWVPCEGRTRMPMSTRDGQRPRHSCESESTEGGR